MDRLGSMASILQQNAKHASSPEAEHDLNQFLKYEYSLFLITTIYSSCKRCIQEHESVLQLKKDRWRLRQGVEAADDEQEILRHLHQIAASFDEFQVRCYSTRYRRLTNQFQAKVLLRIERNTGVIMRVSVGQEGIGLLGLLTTIGTRIPEYAAFS